MESSRSSEPQFFGVLNHEMSTRGAETAVGFQDTPSQWLERNSQSRTSSHTEQLTADALIHQRKQSSSNRPSSRTSSQCTEENPEEETQSIMSISQDGEGKL
jgi:hypothetical protein